MGSIGNGYVYTVSYTLNKDSDSNMPSSSPGVVLQMMHLAQIHVLIYECGGILCVMLVPILDTIQIPQKHF